MKIFEDVRQSKVCFLDFCVDEWLRVDDDVEIYGCEMYYSLVFLWYTAQTCSKKVNKVIKFDRYLVRIVICITVW